MILWRILTVGLIVSGSLARNRQEDSLRQGRANKDACACMEPRDRGSKCKEERVDRYGFNPKSGTCMRFGYGGCGGNNNNFETFEKCRDTCGAKDICEETFAVMGPCFAAFPKYSFNQREERCVKFIYGGCAGNNNNFWSKAECQKRCGGKDAVCKEPFGDTGPCRAYNKRYGFNPKTGKCEKFNYGGCAGNKNRFKSMNKCRETCRGKDICQEPFADQGKIPGCYGLDARWSFNPKKKKCESFLYRACSRSNNNFLTWGECDETCVKQRW